MLRTFVRRYLFSLLVLAIFVGASLLIYWPGLSGPMVLDSTKIFELHAVVEKHGEWAILNAPGFDGHFGRVISMASFVANIQFVGESLAFGLKFTNVLIHGFLGWLIFLLCRRLFLLGKLRGEASWLAIAVAALWLVAPINVSTVLYSIQRMAQLSALFSVLGLLFYVIGRQRMAESRQSWFFFSTAFLLCFPCAYFSKENGILLAPMILLLETVFFRFRGLCISQKRCLHLLLVGLPVSLLAAILYITQAGLLDFSYRDFTLYERLLTQPRVIFGYLNSILMPIGNDPGLFFDDFVISRSWSQPWSTLSSALGVIALFIVLPIGLARSPIFRYLAFGLLFFVTGHLLESTVFPLELYFEHRNYLPSVGIFLAVVLVVQQLAVRVGQMLPITVLMLSLYLAHLSFFSIQKSQSWQSKEHLYTYSFVHHPQSPRAMSSYAQLLFHAGQIQKSLELLDQLVILSPQSAARTYLQKFYFQCRGGIAIEQEQIDSFAKVDGLGLPIEVSQALKNMLSIYKAGNCKGLTLAGLLDLIDVLAQKFVAAGADDWTVRYYAHLLRYESGDLDETFRFLQKEFEQGEIRAGTYLLELLLDNQRYSEIEVIYPSVIKSAENDSPKWVHAWLENFRLEFETASQTELMKKTQ